MEAISRRLGLLALALNTALAGAFMAADASAGTLDDIRGLAPSIEVYADHAAEWVPPIAGAQRFGQGAG